MRPPVLLTRAGPITPGLLVMIALAFLITWRLQQRPPITSAEFLQRDSHRVISITEDGTIVLKSGERVRLLGVREFATESASGALATFLRERLLDQSVRFTFDRERRDVRHHWMAYVWRDDAFINEDVLLHGFAKRDPTHLVETSIRKQLEAAEQAARNLQRGCWQDQEQTP